MGRSAGKVENVEEQLRSLELVDAGVGLAPCGVNMAKDVEVSRLSIPESPPAFDPCPFLDEPMRALYLHPSAASWALDEAEQLAPSVKFRAASKQAKLDLLAALDRCGRLAVFPADEHDARTA